MFSGMDAFDIDPSHLQDMPTEYTQFRALGQFGPASGITKMAEQFASGAQSGSAGPNASYGTFKETSTQATGILSKIAQGLQAKYQAELTAQAAQLEAMKEAGRISQQAYEANMQKIAEKSTKTTFMSRYGTLIVLGGILLAGGIGIYFFVKKGK